MVKQGEYMQESELTRVPRFASPDVDTFQRVLEAKGGFQYGEHEMYFRDGFPALYALETHVAMLVGADRDHVLLTNTGMSALCTAVEVASPTKGDVIVHGYQGYSQTQAFVREDLYERGIQSVAVDSGSLQEIETTIRKYRPKVVLFETVVNGPVMSTLDVEGLLALPALRELNPFVILDNTFPTNASLPLADILQRTDGKVIGVESATKSYALNQEGGGVLYTYDPFCLEKLHRKRRRIGTTPGYSAVSTIQAVIPPTKEQFDREHMLATWNTLMLAKACAEVESDRFVVLYPNLPNHPNYEFASEHFPYGAAPVFFIQPAVPFLSVIDIAKQFEQSGVLKDCHLAQSFCFDKTGVSFDAKGEYLRVAGGLEDSTLAQRLRDGFRQALTAIRGTKGFVRLSDFPGHTVSQPKTQSAPRSFFEARRMMGLTLVEARGKILVDILRGTEQALSSRNLQEITGFEWGQITSALRPYRKDSTVLYQKVRRESTHGPETSTWRYNPELRKETTD